MDSTVNPLAETSGGGQLRCGPYLHGPLIVRLHHQQGGFRHRDARQLPQRRWRPIVVHLHNANITTKMWYFGGLHVMQCTANVQQLSR